MAISYGQLEQLLKNLPAHAYPAAWDALSRLQAAPSAPVYAPPAYAAPPPYAYPPPGPGYPPPVYGPLPAYPPYVQTGGEDDDDGGPGGSKFCEDHNG